MASVTSDATKNDVFNYLYRFCCHKVLYPPKPHFCSDLIWRQRISIGTSKTPQTWLDLNVLSLGPMRPDVCPVPNVRHLIYSEYANVLIVSSKSLRWSIHHKLQATSICKRLIQLFVSSLYNPMAFSFLSTFFFLPMISVFTLLFHLFVRLLSAILYDDFKLKLCSFFPFLNN